MAGVIFAIPANRNLQGLRALTAQQMRSELTWRGIAFDPKDLKADLLPVLALLRLGVVDKYRAADPALVAKVSRWCASPVPMLEATLRDLGIEKGANRWQDIENLIRAEFVLLLLRLSFGFRPQLMCLCRFIYESEDDETDGGGSPESDDQAGLSDQVAFPATKLPSPSVMNLLLTLVYADMSSYATQFFAACPNCPVEGPVKLLNALAKIPTIKDHQHLEALCRPPAAKQNRISWWLSSTFGQKIVEATSRSGLKIPGFTKWVYQFILASPASAHRDRFSKQLKKAKGKSILLFHGTPLQNLQSILRNGFVQADHRAFGSGLYMAEEPSYCYRYATRKTRQEGSEPYGPQYQDVPAKLNRTWPHTPFKIVGALLGCEVAGNGQPVTHSHEPGVHVIRALDSVMIRYIFLIPGTSTAAGLAAAAGAPKRAEVEQAMTAAIKVIRKRKILAVSGTEEEEEDGEDEGPEERADEGESSMS